MADASPAALPSPSPPLATPPSASTPPVSAARPYVFRGEGTGAWQQFSWNAGRLISRIASMLMFRLHVSGQAGIPRTGGMLLVTNHQSFLDPWLIGIAPARQLHYMARDTLFKGGFLQYLAELWNTFPVRRGTADLGAIRTAVDRLDKGFVVNIFPEGTRSEDGTIGTVAPGVALILNRVKSDIPIMPVLIDGAFAAWPRNAKFPRPGPIRIVYGTPIPAGEWRMLGPDALAQRLRLELVKLQEQIKSPYATGSRARFLLDQAKAGAEAPRGRRRRENKGAP